MSSDSLLKDIQQQKFAPIYILQGDESYYIDQIAEAILEHALSETEREFNQTVVYGKDVDPMQLLSVIKRYPMGAQRQLIVLKEAQELRSLEVFAPVLKNPIPTSIFVIMLKGKKLDKRKKFTKEIDKNAVLFTSDKVRDYQLTDWIKNYTAKKNIPIDNRAMFLLSEYLGNDLSKITNELDKLQILVKDGETINPSIIERNIGISKDYNVWELQDAIGKKDILKANKIVKYLGQNEKAVPFEMFVGSMYTFFTKLIKAKKVTNQSALMKVVPGGPYAAKIALEQSRNFSLPKLENCISLLHEYDLRNKGVRNGGTEYGALIQEIVFRFLH